MCVISAQDNPTPTGMECDALTRIGAADTNQVSNSVTFDAVEQGTKLAGSFAAEWDATDGGRVATISGTFDVDF